MKVKYNINPLNVFSDELYLALHNLILPDKLQDNHPTYPIEPLLKKILLNNGCGFKDNATEKMVEILHGYMLCFITGGEGNKVNEFYDFVELHGMEYLVIFLDTFKGIKTSNHKLPDKDKLTSDEVISYGMSTLMGNSVYFDNIKKLVNIFISTVYNQAVLSQGMGATSAADNYRWAGPIIAGRILNSFRPLTEYDVEGVDLHDLQQIILSSNSLDMMLSGIRHQDL
jgi:hypothetical protein